MIANSTRPAFVYVFLLVAALSQTCAAQYTEPPTFNGLGGLPGSGGYHGGANAVSGDGRVVVGYSGSGGSSNRVFRYENGMLSALSGAPSGFVLRDAFGVSYDGSVIVGVGIPDGGQTEAFRWENGVVTRLGDLQGGLPRSVARAVSADGQVVVGYGYGSGGEDEAFRWEDGVMQGLGVIGDADYSRAYGVSSDGRVIIGRSGSSSTGPWAVRWQGGQMDALDIVDGAYSSDACGVSSDGRVIVGWMQGPNGNNIVRWNQGKLELLGTVPRDYPIPCSVSSDGSTIVWGKYIWHSSFGLVELRGYLTDTLELNLSTWSLWHASGVSLDGLTVVGWGVPPQCAGCSEIYHEGWIAFLGRTEPATDEDGDGVVDGVDLCPTTIAGVFVDPAGCPPRVPGDFDRDGDVDLIDYAIWQRCMSGTDEPADPACKTQP